MPVNGRRDEVSELFAGDKTVEAVRVVKYVEWIANKDHPNHGLIALPPIQRSPLWKPAQIVDLWDSLLRGMPFGSFLVARMKGNDDRREFDVESQGHLIAKTSQPNKQGFFLIDGQQRTLTLLLGFCEPPHARLWLDLGQNGTRGRVFALRLTTKSQPFGFDPNDPTRKLSAGEKRKAREDFFKNHCDLQNMYDHQLPLSKTFPWNAKLPVLMAELWRAWLEREKDGTSDAWWRKVVKSSEGDENACAKSKPEIIDQLDRAFLRLDSTRLPLILVPDHLLDPTMEVQSGPEQDALEILYTRIGTGGTVLSGEEHVFSLIKHRWPQAHDLVHELYLDEKIGQILKPTEIVMTAVRLVRAARGDDDVPKPRVPEFRRWLTGLIPAPNESIPRQRDSDRKPQQLSSHETLVGFVGNGDPKSSRLQAAFERFRDLINHQPKIALDPGLPKVFVPYLNLPAIQVVLRWIDLNRGFDSEFFEPNRNDVLRFLLFWHVAVSKENEASAAAFRKFREARAGESFPGRSLYEDLVRPDQRGQPFALRLPHPETLWAVLDEETVHLRKWEERFNPAKHQGEKSFAVSFLQRWWSAKELLLWLQREQVEKWFSGYDPLAGRDEDTPYDYDHILPRDHWLAPDGQFADPDARDRFYLLWNRDLIGNAIGNYRVWPSSDNRSLGSDPPSLKLGLEALPGDPLNNDRAVVNLLMESAINQDESDIWKEASGDKNMPRRWSDARVMAFQTAVERRVAWLYKRFYNELHFDLWV